MRPHRGVRRWWWVTLGAATLLLCPASGDGQESSPPLTFSEEVAVRWILVPVVVRSRSGYVEGLKARDFQVFVDGQKVAFEGFESRAEAPVSLVYLQDLSGSMSLAAKLETSRAGLRVLLGHGRPSDEFALATFAGGRMEVEVPFTAHFSVLEEAMARWEAYGTTGLHDAVAWLPEISLGSRRMKRAAVLVTDGEDNASLLAPEVARSMVQRTELPVYVVALDPHRGPTEGPASAEADERTRELGELALHTGGRYYSVSGTAEVEEACASIAADLRNQYVLSFSTSGTGEPRYRALEVRVRGRARRPIYRRGYYGFPPHSLPNEP